MQALGERREKSVPYKVNSKLNRMQCIGCRALYPLDDYFEGCPVCLEAGAPTSVVPHYTEWPPSLEFETIGDWLSYPDASGLGEGNTSLSKLPRLAAALGISALSTKNEFANPTGSHKDRMVAKIVQRAVCVGAKTIAVASSGNAGVSMAAYAARNGLDCVVVTTPDISPNWRRAIEMHGARIIATATPDDRWALIAHHAQAGDWYPATNYIIPPVGSNPFGVDAYRAIALELYLQLQQEPPTDIVVPTARGDLLWGISKGYQDLRDAGFAQSIPRVHAVEPYPRIHRALSGQGLIGAFPDDTIMGSIGGITVSQQSLQALNMTNASSVAVDDDTVSADQLVVAREGLYLELSSVATLSGLRKLINEQKVAENAHVVLVATSHGYKEYPRFANPRVSID
ncbi:threonine synthase [Mesorhizobium carmichaelinearum]|uniref:threonine synthase n=1 Tax=Mesorhizobium carmichaelinearum TaxID=1208188 RepID=UPI000BA43F5C|nr:pyridoxal-phosphate dependent enzyme [Mesorhizobium carmichaelinearum]